METELRRKKWTTNGPKEKHKTEQNIGRGNDEKSGEWGTFYWDKTFGGGKGKGKGRISNGTRGQSTLLPFPQPMIFSLAFVPQLIVSLLLLLLSIWPPSAHPNIVIKVAHLQPNNPSIINEPQVAHETMSLYYSTGDGSMPQDMPKCGFDGHLCDYTLIYILFGSKAANGAKAFRKERMLYEMIWRIPREQVRLLEQRSKTKSMSIRSRSQESHSYDESIGSKANSRLLAKQALANGVKCAFKRYQQNRSISFNKFYGICFNQQKGSLEDVLFNAELKIGRNFQVSFTKDVVKVCKWAKLKRF
ncbi:hypothetical protein niasHT_003773 [Heterodera trifolii]|uniref:Uncharacterized protein n=1 Tax=Heterodera trifolii TaxID=157864 RepID=A0ABD2LWL3_9BILA